MRIAHNSSGTDLLILLNLLSCAKLKRWNTAGKRPFVTQVTDCRFGARDTCMPPYGPEVALLLHVTKRLALRTHLLLSVKSLQYLLNLCIAKIVLSTFQKLLKKSNPSRKWSLLTVRHLSLATKAKARLHSRKSESAGSSCWSRNLCWFQRRLLGQFLVLFRFTWKSVRMIGWRNTRNALGKLEELLTCKVWWVFC